MIDETAAAFHAYSTTEPLSGPTMTTDDDRGAYLEGEDRPGLDAEERRALDDIRSLLADPALWEEPPARLEADVVAAVTSQAAAAANEARHESRRLDRRRLLAVAAAV